MTQYKRELDLGYECKATIYFRQPSYEDREQFTSYMLLNAPLMLDKKTSNETKRKALHDMTELAYNAGAEIITKIECNQWPEWMQEKLEQGKKPKDLIVEFFSPFVVDLGREIVGGQASDAKRTNPESIELAKQVLADVNLESEQTKN